MLYRFKTCIVRSFQRISTAEDTAMATNKMKHAWTVVLSSFLVTFCCSTTSAVHFAGRQVPSLQPSANPSRPGPAPDACTAGADVCPPAPPAGDKAVVQGLQAGISVQYSCIDNYVKIDGQEQLNCISGAWNGKPLRCGGKYARLEVSSDHTTLLHSGLSRLW